MAEFQLRISESAPKSRALSARMNQLQNDLRDARGKVPPPPPPQLYTLWSMQLFNLDSASSPCSHYVIRQLIG